jgi:hypothetical protein
MSMPSHDLLANCDLLLVWETRPQVHFWLVDKLSRLQPSLELWQFAQALLKPRHARWKVSFPYRVTREPNYNILSEWMTYYSTWKEMCYALILDAVTKWPPNLERFLFWRHNRCNQYLFHVVFWPSLAAWADSLAPTCLASGRALKLISAPQFPPLEDIPL